MRMNSRTVYIVNVSDHWVTLTNINAHDKNRWLFLDSLNRTSYLNGLKPVLKKIAHACEATERFMIYSVRLAMQEGSFDCGLYAVAYAIELCMGNNPAGVCFDQDLMRFHFNECVDKNQLLPFPQKNKTPRTIYTRHMFDIKSL